MLVQLVQEVLVLVLVPMDLVVGFGGVQKVYKVLVVSMDLVLVLVSMVLVLVLVQKVLVLV